MPETFIVLRSQTGSQGRVRHLPVINDGKVVGMISIGDVVKQRLDDAELEVESLRGYVTM